MTSLPRSEWVDLIPHRGRMSLLDEVVCWQADRLHARSTSHRQLDHPLRTAAGLHVVHLIEYAAQATAVHGALLARRDALPPLEGGRLVSLREVRLGPLEQVPDRGVVDVRVERLLGDHDGAHYLFEAAIDDERLVQGRMAVMYGRSD